MEVNNFKCIKELMRFDEVGDDFYHIQIIKRRKENPGMHGDSVTVMSYYIRSIEELDKRSEEMIDISKKFNARIYINMNTRSFKQIAFKLNSVISDYLIAGSFRAVNKIYDTCCSRYGKIGGRKNNFYIVDIDFECSDEFRSEICGFINSIKPDIVEDKVKLINKTLNGQHLLCSVFDVNKFMNKYNYLNEGKEKKVISVLKNQLTLLYYSDQI